MKLRSRFFTIIMSLFVMAAMLSFDGIFAFADSSDSSVQSADVIRLPYSGSELDSLNNNQLIFHNDKNGLFFVSEKSGSIHVTFYDIASGSSEVVYTYSMLGRDLSYYDESSRTLFFLGETHARNDADPVIYTPHLTALSLDTLNTSELDLETFSLDSSWWNLLSGFGVDPLGRAYVATNENQLFVYDPDGSLLGNTTVTGEPIRAFNGFDAANGNFYYTGMYVWTYWGYDHYMSALMAGNVDSSGKITLPEKNLMIFYQNGFYEHKQPAAMISSNYLATLSTFNKDQLCIIDSGKYDVNDYTQQGTSISMIDSSVNTSLLNISNMEAVVAASNTAASNYSGYLDISSEGTRCCMNGDGNLIVKTAKDTLTEYDIGAYEQTMRAKTAYEPYDFSMFGDTCVVVERNDEDLYLECIDWKLPADFTISVQQNLKVGDTVSAACTNEGPMEMSYQYSISDPSVVTVDENGILSAWKKGTAVLTAASNETGQKKNITINVSDSALSGSSFSYSYTHAEGTATSNIHLPRTDGYYGETTGSYLAVDGSDFVRVEHNDNNVIVESYDRSFTLKKSSALNCELELFGGFYSGKDAYYLVFGQPNPNEDNSREVIRVVKYDKSWKRLGSCSVNGANTYEPFDAGGLSMCEYDGYLYIHTCHTMYDSGDGYHHQANCDFKIQESDMTLADSYTDVMNLSEGYVSHSFMQKVRTDGEYLYRADLGDYYPRGIALTATSLESTFDNPAAYATIVNVVDAVSNYNYTGYELSGLELSDTHYIVVGSGSTEEDYHHNVFVSASGKYSLKNNTQWITHNSEYNVNICMPKLVKLNNNQFMLLWEESDSSTGKYITKAVLLGPDGSTIGSEYSLPLSLSECEPVVDSDGCVVWYFTNGGAPVFCRINPFRLKEAAAESAKDPVIAADAANSNTDPSDDPQNGDSSGDAQNGDIQEKPPVTDPSGASQDNTVFPSDGNTGSDGSGKGASDPAKQTGADGTAFGKGASVDAAENALAAMKSDSDPSGTVFRKLQLKSTKQTKTSITLKWKKVSGAKSYVIYGNKCGSSSKFKKIAKVKGTSRTVKKLAGSNLKKGKYYKFIVIALDKNKNVVSASKIVHVATKGGKVGNYKKVTTKAKKNKVTIRKGKTFKLGAKAVAVSKKLKVKSHRKIKYESSNKKIATVSKTGKITGKKKGSCYVYAYAQNGVFAKIKVVVKK